MDTLLLALDCVINVGILGWLVYEYSHPHDLVMYIRDKKEDPPS